jgi:signal recognition particle receptor subunit beta
VVASDLDDRAVVISVVYDGPPRAGKTTSVRALAASFGREVYTPEERNGRTVYFDWLEHVGGRFEGLPIHCQIASVPGQRHWRRRRAHFLDRADVVVFVGDTTAGAWPETVERLVELRRALDDREGTPVGLVFQANKRDCEDAVSLDEIKRQAANARTAVVESIAQTGLGIRESFVFAVRLALDRVRAEGVQRAILQERSGFGSSGGPELLDLVRGLDASTEEVPSSAPRTGPPAPRPPSQDAPSGFVWPPVEGRIILREAATVRPDVRVVAGGDCTAQRPGWSLHSRADAVFDDVEVARTQLVRWARKHAMAQDLLSRPRCIVLAETGDGRWRLWQVVGTSPSLRALAVAESDRLVESFAGACRQASLPIPCTLDTIGLSELAQPVFVGLMPDADAQVIG